MITIIIKKYRNTAEISRIENSNRTTETMRTFDSHYHMRRFVDIGYVVVARQGENYRLEKRA